MKHQSLPIRRKLDTYTSNLDTDALRYNGSLIYFDEKLFQFGQSWNYFDLRTSTWVKQDVATKRSPQNRYLHKTVKFRHFAVLFGGCDLIESVLRDTFMFDVPHKLIYDFCWFNSLFKKK